MEKEYFFLVSLNCSHRYFLSLLTPYQNNGNVSLIPVCPVVTVLLQTVLQLPALSLEHRQEIRPVLNKLSLNDKTLLVAKQAKHHNC